MITTKLISSCHWETLVYFFACERKGPENEFFNTNSELSQNRTEKQITPSKTAINLLFNDT